MHRFDLLTRALLFFAIAIFISGPADAARIEKVSKKQVLIDAEGEDLQEGQKFFVIIDEKKRASCKSRSKNGKAIGKITKGKAVVDARIEAATGGGSKSADGGEEASPKKRKKRGGDSGESSGSAEPGLYVGGLLGVAMDSQNVKDSTGTSVSMSGIGYSLKAFGDMPISGKLGLIGRAGIEQLNLKGDVTGRSLQTAIMYATADLLLRFSFGEGRFVPFGAGGLGLHFPLSKSSDVLDVPRISSTTVFFIDGGFNMQMNDNMILTAVAEYGLFPPSNDVSTNFIAIRGGAGFRF